MGNRSDDIPRFLYLCDTSAVLITSGLFGPTLATGEDLPATGGDVLSG